MHGLTAIRFGAPRVLLVAAALLLSHGISGAPAGASALPDDPKVPIPDSLRGRSGQLRAFVVRASAESLATAPVADLLGPDAVQQPAVWTVTDSASAAPFHFITLRPFAEKRDGRVGVYRVGRWPSETRRPLSDAYRLPAGFIEVTESNRALQISTHFRLEDFLDRGQREVWPKALVLDLRLVDKLELVLQELEMMGHRAPAIRILSGFRTPQANARGPRSGQSSESRHLYGDGADIIVDSDGDGAMDDLTRDRRVDERDVLALIAIIETVEDKYPGLVGGIGRYRSAGGSGMFVHVDVRGTRVRWGP
jgi:hypothetical protein